MTLPPDRRSAEAPQGQEAAAPSFSPCPQTAARLQTIVRRSDFLRAAQARRQAMPGLLLQARRRDPDGGIDPVAVRVGFTCSKKVGNSVTRNRARRRLRAIARSVLAAEGRSGWDYVLVGRPGATVERGFADLLADLRAALARVHAPRPPRGGDAA